VFHVDLEGTKVHVNVSEGAVEVRRDGALVRVIAANEAWDGSTDEVKAAPSASVTVTLTPPPPAPPRPPAPGPKELMAQADEARIAGKPRDAAVALDALRRQYRSDPRAGIAAFELGRLRLDALGDPKGAVEALDDALVLSPHASFREDAEARRVEALDRTHDPRCASARDAYAEHYPSGVHLLDVNKRCK
jgi:tetratricopeptide (TPR) repeat protein